MPRDVLLISVQPVYANKIFDESKTVELRISLGYLKQLLSGFQPPQSYRYLSQAEVSLVTDESYRFKRRELLAQMPL
jgi:hypothetical protein